MLFERLNGIMTTMDSDRNMSDYNGKLEHNTENGIRDSIDDNDRTCHGEDHELTHLLKDDVEEESGNESIHCGVKEVLDVLSAWTSHFSMVSWLII